MRSLIPRRPPRRRFNLDLPAKGARLHGEITVSGWYVTPAGQPADFVQVRIGRRILACQAVERPDVVAAHPATVRGLRCGFLATFATRPGLKLLRIVAVHDGREHTLAARLVRFSPWRPVQPSAETLDSIKRRLKAESRSRLSEFLDSNARLAFAAPTSRPEISILIPVWNQAALTLDCLRSVRAAAAGLDCEVLVADNASTDESARLWTALDGVRVVRNRKNLGFLRAVNALAGEARGEHLLLLNNDATLAPDALRFALETLRRRPELGAVGARVILPDGRLQEAGNTILADGACAGWARGFSPDDPRAQDWKFTDYVSGVFLLTPRAVFARLGGFDEAFAPAYYEDVDYCVRLWKNGLRVAYDPRVVVFHHEYGSAASDDAAIRRMRKNRVIFQDRHHAWLADQPAATEAAAGIRRQAYEGHVLLIDDRVPAPAHGAGAPRMLEMLSHLVTRGRKVAFYPMISATASELAWISRRFDHAVQVLQGFEKSGLAAFLAANIARYDELWISRPHNMACLNAALKSLRPGTRPPRILYDAEAVYALRTLEKMRLDGRAANGGQERQMIAEEVALAGGADLIVTVSEAEARLFREFSLPGKNIRVLGHTAGAPDATTTGFSDRDGLFFIGRLADEDSPNVDSIRWFLREVFPLIVARLPTTCTLAGDCGAPSLSGLASPSVRFLGPVENPAGHLDRSRVFIAPTRFAAGIPLKVIGAAARGLPVVCTPILAAQLGWTHEREALVADTPAGFADACVRLHTDAALWEHLRRRSGEHYARNFSPEAFAAQADAILADIRQDGYPFAGPTDSR